MTFRNGAHSVVRFRSSYTNFGRFRYYSREEKGERGEGKGGRKRGEGRREGEGGSKWIKYEI